MRIRITGRKNFGACRHHAGYCILLFILMLSVTPSAKGEESSDSSINLPIRTLDKIDASQENGRLTVNIKMNRLLEPTVFMVDNPPRLVIDFFDTVNRVPFKKMPLNAASVRQVRVGQFQSADPRIARVVFDLDEGFGTHTVSLDKSSVKVTFLPGKTIADKTVSTSDLKSESAESTKEMPVSRQQEDNPVRSGVSSEEGASGQTASRSLEKTVASVQNPGTVSQNILSETSTLSVPSTASAKTAPTPERRDSVESNPPLSQKSVNKIHSPKSTESRASSTAAKLPEESKAKDAPAANVMQASLERRQDVSAPEANPPSGVSRAVMDPATSSLGATLDRIGKSVEQFQKRFESVSCTEFVSQTKLGEKNKVIYKKEYEYDYMIFMDILKDGISVEESREEKRTKGKTKDLPLLVTQGFPTLLLIFHPYYQGSFEYQYGGEEIVEKRKLVKIAFRHIRGKRSTSVLHLKGKNYPLELKGTAWIDPDSSNIKRIRAELINPMEALGLQVFNSDVRYTPMQFASNSPTFWMPETATVEVRTMKQHWRNVHRFEDYSLFSISSESEIAVP